jgi:divalent metal cation (Fe/Co/Zn/Cd) transporter
MLLQGHSLSDLLSDFVTLATLRVSRLPPDADHPYGHGRFEALGALLIASLLCTTALAFGNHAYEGLLEAVALTAAQATAAAESAAQAVTAAAPGVGAAAGAVATAAAAELATTGSNAATAAGWWHLGKEQFKGHVLAAGAALVSILSKEVLFVATKKVGERTNSPVLVANAWHHRSDALSSVLVDSYFVFLFLPYSASPLCSSATRSNTMTHSLLLKQRANLNAHLSRLIFLVLLPLLSSMVLRW